MGCDGTREGRERGVGMREAEGVGVRLDGGSNTVRDDGLKPPIS